MPLLSPYLTPILLLTGSNVFMTAAWYWHLRYKEVPLFKVILISWGLALIEYCLAVPVVTAMRSTMPPSSRRCRR